MGRIELGLALVVILYATALLTSIKAKITGNFFLQRFGPTEFKTLLACYGLAIACVVGFWGSTVALTVATVTILGLLGIGLTQLAVNLIKSVREVNGCGAAADTTPWQLDKSR